MLDVKEYEQYDCGVDRNVYEVSESKTTVNMLSEIINIPVYLGGGISTFYLAFERRRRGSINI